MKQRCWKELKKQLCPPEKWIKDSDRTKCHCCSKSFNLLFRRRHHCRFCGNLFCSGCSQYFINGNYIEQSTEKYVRNCEFCHKKIQKLIRQWTKMPIVYGEENAQNGQEKSDEPANQGEEDDDMWNFGKLFEETEKTIILDPNQILEQTSASLLTKGAEQLCDKFYLNKQMWAQKLVILAQRAAVEAKMEALVRDQQMDITKKVKIRIIKTSGKVFHSMIKGVVLFKNLSSKKMQTQLSTSFTDPKVLVIDNSLDLISMASTVPFEELVKNEKAILNEILQKIVQPTPDIIFVENNVHLYALDYLQNQKIVVINKLKENQLDEIKKVTGVKKSKKTKGKFLLKYGKCDKISFNKEREGQTMIFIETEKSGVRTILLGEENEEETRNLKKVTKMLMKLARQLNLEKHFIIVEKQLKDAIIKKQYALPLVEDFNQMVYQSMDSFLFHQEISYSKILFNDIWLSEGGKTFQQYALFLPKSSYKEMCGKIEFFTKKKYTNSDFTLGTYILLQVANFKIPCKQCQKRYTHREQYYLNDCVVTIITEQLEGLTFQRANSSIISENGGQKFTIEKFTNELLQQKQVVTIKASTVCSKCGSKVGHSGVKVQKGFLSNSFHHVLHNIVIAYNSGVHLHTGEVKQQCDKNYAANQQASIKKQKVEQCEHSILVRTYQYLGFKINVNVQKKPIFTIDYIDLVSKKSQQYIVKEQKKFMKTTYENQLNEKNKILQKITTKVNSLTNMYFSGTMTLITDQLNTFQKIIEEIKDILQKCKEELKEVKSKLNEESNQMRYDCPLLFFRIMEVESVLKVTFTLINQIERTLIKIKTEEIQLISNSQILLGYEADLMTNSNIGHQNRDYTFLNRYSSEGEPTFLDEEINEYLKKKSKKAFPRIQNIYFLFPEAYTDEPVTLAAVCINICINSTLYQQKINQSCEEIQLKIQYDKRLKTKWQLSTRADKIHSEVLEEVGNRVFTLDMTVYYPKEFQILRKKWGIDNDLYIRGLLTCKNWGNSGGKSKSQFAKSENDLLVLKIINEKQFDEFLKFAKDYVLYLNSEALGKKTLMAKIFGIYQILVKGKTFKCVVMQNLNFFLKNIKKVYDLKGSQVNRLSLPPDGGVQFTGQDSNFKIDKEGEPYILRGLEYDSMMTTLQEDLDFLKNHQVIDYSLLVIENENTLRLGIIDYMRPYQLIEKIQNIYKQLKHGCNPTVIPPNQYAERFIGAIKRYFLKML